MSARLIGLWLLMSSAVAVVGAQSSPAAVQMSQAAFARVTYHRVAPGSEAEFERFMREAWRPIFQAQRQAGRAANWILYRVHLTGSNDEYNYASVSYHDTWAKTEGVASWSAVVRESNPVTAKVMIARTRELGPIVRQSLFGRVDFVSRQNGRTRLSLDKTSRRIVAVETQPTPQGAWRDRRRWTDFAQSGGLWWPRREDRDVDGEAVSTWMIRKVVVNGPVDSMLFRRPIVARGQVRGTE